MRPFLISLLLSIICLPVWTQNPQASDVKRTSHLKTYAQSAIRQNDIYTAILFYEEFLIRKPNALRIVRRLAPLYEKTYHYEKAANAYKSIYQSNPGQYQALYHLGDMMMSLAQYDSASVCFNKYLLNINAHRQDDWYSKTLRKLEGCEYAKSETLKTIPKKNIEFLEAINTPYAQSSPMLYDSSTLIYSGMSTNTEGFDSQKNKHNSQFLAAEIWNDTPSKTKDLPEAFQNINLEEVANAAFSPDGKRLYFTSQEKNAVGQTLSYLYVRHYESGSWLQAQKLESSINLQFYNTTQAAVAPSYSSQLEIIYFASDRPGGFGGYDIWYTIYNKYSKRYTKPVNAGPIINTSGDELSPFYDTKEDEFYFSSDGHPGFGGLDVFMARGSMVNWTKPQNMGAEINSPQNDLHYAVYPKQKKTFFVSNRIESTNETHIHCCYDIFEYFIPDSNRFIIQGSLTAHTYAF